MNQRIRRLIAIVVFWGLVMGACQSETPALMPVTGVDNKSSLPTQVSLAQQKVLDYVLASRLASIPSQADWELQEIQNESEYHFRSGNWLMVIWMAEKEQCRQVVIVNRAESQSWTGYLAPDGHVVDTDFSR